MLSLLAPAGLFLGLTLPAVIILYLLRVRRTDHRVSSLLLWQAMPRDLAAQEPLQRLRLSVLLFLQLALLALLTLALARPALTVLARPPMDLVLVLDASASMQATDPGEAGSRFERALAATEATVRAAPEGSSFTIMEARGYPQVLLSRESDAFRALEAVRAARVSGVAADMARALLLARSLVGRSGERRIVVFTDQAFSLANKERDQLGANVEVVFLGGQASNSAITAVGAGPSPGAPDAQDVFVRLERFGAEARSVGLELRLTDQVRERSLVELRPDEAAELVFEGLPNVAGAAAVAIVDAADSLALDDVGYLALQDRRPSRVLLVSNGEPRLERALSLVPGSEVFKVVPRRYLATDVDSFDVVVFDREVPPLLPRGNVLILGPSGTAPFLPPGPLQVVRQPQAVIWERDDPLLTYVDLRGLSIRRARALDPPAWARTLLRGDGVPLMFAGRDPAGRRVAVLGFAPSESNLDLLPAFPILVANLMAWLAPPALVSSHQLLTGGATDLIPLPRARELLVSGPGPAREGGERGRVVIPIPAERGPVSFGATDQPGIYTLQQRADDGSLLPEASERFAVNLTDAGESDLRPRGDSIATTASEGAREVPRPREFFPWLLGLALPLLALEGWWFHRRA